MSQDTINTVEDMSMSQIEALLLQYTLEFDLSIDQKQKLRGLKCGFCGYIFKYQNALNYHGFNKHIIGRSQRYNRFRTTIICSFIS